MNYGLVCPKVWIRCTRCGQVFLRYDYGKGKRRMRKWTAGRKGYSENTHAKLSDSCILCRGPVEIIDPPKNIK